MAGVRSGSMPAPLNSVWVTTRSPANELVDHVVDRRLDRCAERGEQGHDGGTDHQGGGARRDAPGVAHRVAPGQPAREATGEAGAGPEHRRRRAGHDGPEDDEADEHGQRTEPGPGDGAVLGRGRRHDGGCAERRDGEADDGPDLGGGRAVDGDVAHRRQRRHPRRLQRRGDAGDQRRQDADGAGDDDRVDADRRGRLPGRSSPEPDISACRPRASPRPTPKPIADAMTPISSASPVTAAMT